MQQNLFNQSVTKHDYQKVKELAGNAESTLKELNKGIFYSLAVDEKHRSD